MTRAILTNEAEVGNMIARVTHAIETYMIHPEAKRVIQKEMEHMKGKLYEGHFSPFSQR